MAISISDDGKFPERTPRSPSPGPDMQRHFIQVLQNKENVLRRQGILVAINYATFELWLFAWKNDMEETLRNTKGSLDSLIAAESGTVSASQLLKTGSVLGPRNGPSVLLNEPANRISQMNFQAHSSNAGAYGNTSLNANENIHSGQIELPLQSNANTGPSRYAREIYEYFFMALLKLISWQLCNNHSFIPLNIFTFAAPTSDSTWKNNGGKLGYLSSADDFPRLGVLNLQMTPIGDIIVSLSWLSQSRGEKAFRFIQPDASSYPRSGTDVWLAPSGRIARLVGPEVLLPDNITTTTPTTKAYNVGSNIRGTQSKKYPATRKWKENIIVWLQHRGLGRLKFEKWMEVQILDVENYPEVREDFTLEDRIKTILWPAELCYCRPAQSTESISNSVKWYRPPDQGGWIDPLDFAEKWVSNKDEREKKLKEARVARKTQEVSKTQSKQKELNWEDPLQNLDDFVKHPYLDVQAPGTFYPTPPDGAPPQGQIASAMHDSLTTSPLSGEVQTANQTGVKVIAPHERDDVGNIQPDLDPMEGLELGVGPGEYFNGGDEDLFGDLDTTAEADFSFFDEPITNEIIMDDAPHGIENDGNDEQNANITKGSSNAGQTQTLGRFTNDTPNKQRSVPPADMGSNHGLVTSKATKTKTGFGKHLASAVTGSPARARELNTKNQFLARSPPPSPLNPRGKAPILGSSQEISSGRAPQHLSRKRSMFEAVDFGDEYRQSDKKYEADGYFSYNLPKLSKLGRDKPKDIPAEIPRIGFPRHSYDEDDTSSDTGSSQISRSPSWSEDGPDTEHQVDGDDDTQNRDEDELEEPKSYHDVNLNTLELDLDMWPLDESFFHPVAPALPVSPGIIVQVSQILATQIAHSTLRTYPENKYGTTFQLEGLGEKQLSLPTNDAMKRMTGNGAPCTLEEYSNYFKQSVVDNCIKIPTPFVRLKRGEDKDKNTYGIELLPSAIPFWEIFSFKPLSGPKNISAYCICPSVRQVIDGANTFLDHVAEIYEKCWLGSHTRGFDDGMVLVELKDLVSPDMNSVMEATYEVCEQLGTNLAKLPAEGCNLVIYMVNPFPGLTAYAYLCNAFLKLCHTYFHHSGTPGRSPDQNQPVLQIVSLDMIAARNSLVVSTQAEYRSMALEVYERCQSADPEIPENLHPIFYQPAFLLKKPPPSEIKFELKTESPFSLLEENSCFHVAYSQSPDERWITACWTDNYGANQMTMAYCLQSRGSRARRPISDILKEIWELTLQILKLKRISWRLFIVKDSPMEQEEKAVFWNLLYAAPANEVKMDLTLLTVDPNPPLNLALDIPPLNLGQSNTQAGGTYSTPVSTPQDNIFSPDASGNAPTPASGNLPSTPNDQNFDSDPDTTLIDITDETWSVLLSHPLNISKSITNPLPAIKSGYLIKRKGSTEGDGMVTMSASIIYVHDQHRDMDALMNSVLKMYRELSTLARVKGVSERGVGILPWHVAISKKVMMALVVTL
ncbi:MAG: mediator of RNA polymerase II transcription subunit 13 [Cirrosporium novae-zelandiae]|nr:MAG: mediator of RNA polymerase II transcription subunit 13 [Cirrosporium novae-zelandiae]